MKAVRCGKTTQIQNLANHIKSITTTPFIVTREPGGVPAAELIRGILVNGDAETWHPATEGLLTTAARHAHVEQVIRPALVQISWLFQTGLWINNCISGYVGGVSADDIAAMNKIACGDIYPDVTIILDIDTQIGLARAKSRRGWGDRFEAKGHAFHEKVRAGFLEIAADAPSRCLVIDANRTQDAIAADVWRVVRPHLLTRGLIGNE